MIYVVTIRLAFSNEGQAQGLYNHAVGVLSQAHTVNPGELYEEKGLVRWEKCYHDQKPVLPCEITDEAWTP